MARKTVQVGLPLLLWTRNCPSTFLEKKKSSPQFKTEMNLPCTSRTVSDVLQKNSSVRLHVNVRITNNGYILHWQNFKRSLDWNSLRNTFLLGLNGKMWCFEKWWKNNNLDEPDGFCHYWYDLRKDKALFPNGDSEVTWWCAQVLQPKERHVLSIRGCLNSESYVHMLA